MSSNLHEQYERPELPLPPDRSTGFVFTIVALIAAYLWRTDPAVWKIALGIAAILAVASLTAPILLRPLNIVWMRFALLLSRVMNPVVMMALYLVAIVPAGLIMQTRYDPLRRKRRGRCQELLDREEARPQGQHGEPVLIATAMRPFSISPRIGPLFASIGSKRSRTQHLPPEPPIEWLPVSPSLALGERTMLSLVKELAAYMSARKKWWLLPVIAVLLVVGGLLVLAQGSAIAPFIYTVF